MRTDPAPLPTDIIIEHKMKIGTYADAASKNRNRFNVGGADPGFDKGIFDDWRGGGKPTTVSYYWNGYGSSIINNTLETWLRNVNKIHGSTLEWAVSIYSTGTSEYSKSTSLVVTSPLKYSITVGDYGCPPCSTLDWGADIYTDWVFVRTYTSTEPNNSVGSETSGNFPLDSPLPVELTSFKALLRVKNIELTWETKTEVNNYGFDIERYTDIKQSLWEKIGFVSGHGSSNTPNTYSFTDVLDASQMTAEKIGYRLHQIDRDGTTSYSNVVEVYFAQPKAFLLEQNYPNPFGAGASGNPSTTIQYSIPVDNRVILRVFDVYSREIATLKNEDQKADYYNVTFDANQLPSGTYFYRIEAGTFTKTMKMHLMR